MVLVCSRPVNLSFGQGTWSVLVFGHDSTWARVGTTILCNIWAMSGPADVIVVGGGVLGICTAYYLAQQGARVTILERDQLASACSFANACLITISHSIPIASPGVIKQALKWMFRKDSPFLLRPRFDLDLFSWLVGFAHACNESAMGRAIEVLSGMSLASIALFEELLVREQFSFDYSRSGLLSVYTTGQEFEKGRHEAALLGQHGIESEVLNGTQARQLEPSLNKQVMGAVFFPQDAHGDCYRFSLGMANTIRKMGVAIFTNEKVTGFTHKTGCWVVRSTSQEFSAESIVFATGSWASESLKSLGARIPLQPGKGYSVTIPRPASSPRIPVMNAAKKVVITPLGGRLRFAGTMEFDKFDLSIRKTRTDAVLRGGLEVLNIVQPHEVDRWCGLRPCTPDGLPVIDRVGSHPNCYVATGHAMLGYTLGPITGKLVAEMVAGSSPCMDIHALRLNRF